MSPRRRQRELTAVPKSNRWQKKYRGHVLRYHGCKGRNDTEGYQQALPKWHADKERIDNQQDTKPWEELRTWLAENGHENLADQLADELPSITTQDLTEVATINPSLAALLAKGERYQRNGKPKPVTVGGAVGQFLDGKKLAAETGAISPIRFDTIRRCLNGFRDFVGAGIPLADVTSKTLLDFHAHLLQRIKRKDFGAGHGTTFIKTVKQFIRWADVTELLDKFPRIINSRELTIKVETKAVPTFTLDEVKALLAEATDTTKLYLLLALNCGFTQVDVSSLLPSEVDFQRGTITRKRTKTKECENVPTVQFPLWNETIRLLRINQSSNADHFLTTLNDTPLKMVALINGKVSHKCIITGAYNDLAKRLGQPKPFKILRKTSSSLLAGEMEYATVADLFLGHAPRGMAEKHYTAAPQKILNNGVKWLGTQYGVE
jgi:integrase